MSWTAKPAVRTKVYHKPYIPQLVRNHPSRLIPLKNPPPKAQCSVNKVNAIATIFSPTPESIICLQINNLVPPASLPHYAVLEYGSLLPTPLQALHGYPTSLVKLQPGDRPINRTQTNSRPHAQIELLLDSQYQYVLEYLVDSHLSNQKHKLMPGPQTKLGYGVTPLCFHWVRFYPTSGITVCAVQWTSLGVRHSTSLSKEYCNDDRSG